MEEQPYRYENLSEDALEPTNVTLHDKFVVQETKWAFWKLIIMAAALQEMKAIAVSIDVFS